VIPAVSYQGSKTRLAKSIVEKIEPKLNNKTRFYDMCCGNGSISLYLVSQGLLKPEQITMIDAGPWGLVWQQIGNGSFSIDTFEKWCNRVPNNPKLTKPFMENLSRFSSSVATPYVFLLLQASSFGGKAIWIDGSKWKTHGFRSYWEPTETSNRRSHVNPMMPMPDTLFERVKEITKGMKGVTGICDSIEKLRPQQSVIYIDPPYGRTTAYGHEVADIKKTGIDMFFGGNEVFISEGEPLGENAVCLSNGRAKGGISGNRNIANKEWLTHFGSVSLDNQ
jgi:16S rRNA G966 N2-methylase RsmD